MPLLREMSVPPEEQMIVSCVESEFLGDCYKFYIQTFTDVCDYIILDVVLNRISIESEAKALSGFYL